MKTNINMVVEKGHRSRFRWYLRDEKGKLLASAPPNGFTTEREAKEAVWDLQKRLHIPLWQRIKRWFDEIWYG